VFSSQVTGGTEKGNANHGDGRGDRQWSDEAQDKTDHTLI